MKKIALIGFLISFATIILAQKKQQIIPDKISSRVVVSPLFNPVQTYFSKYKSASNSEIKNSINESLSAGIRIEKYTPLKRIDYGVDFSVNHYNESFFTPDALKFNETSISALPFLSLKSNTNITDIKHWFINIGLKFNSTVNSNFQRQIGNSVNSLDNIPVRKFRMYSKLEIGLKKDIFYNSSWNYGKRSGVSNFSLGFELPFFNQSYLFKYKNTDFNADFAPFLKSRTIPLGFTINYSQLFDLRQNEVVKPYSDPEGLIPSSKKWQFMPPLFHTIYPETKIFGTFYLKTIYSGNVDSVFVQTPTEQIIYNRSQSAAFEFGYNLHFFSNSVNTIEHSQEKEQKWFRDLFIGGGFSNRIFQLTNTEIARVDMINLQLKAGLRIGYKGKYLTMGYKRIFPVKESFYRNGVKEDLINYSNLKNDIIFIGIGIKNSIYFHVNYRVFDTLSMTKNRSNYLEYTIGFGI